MARAYEGRIRKRGEKKQELAAKSQKTGPKHRPFEEMYERAMTFLSNPHKLWGNGRFEEKRIVLRLAFLENLTYHRDKGFRTI